MSLQPHCNVIAHRIIRVPFFQQKLSKYRFLAEKTAPERNSPGGIQWTGCPGWDSRQNQKNLLRRAAAEAGSSFQSFVSAPCLNSQQAHAVAGLDFEVVILGLEKLLVVDPDCRFPYVFLVQQIPYGGSVRILHLIVVINKFHDNISCQRY